jgi:hypothetical protein
MRIKLTTIVMLLLVLVSGLNFTSCGETENDDSLLWGGALLAAGVAYYLLVEDTDDAEVTIVNNAGDTVMVWIDGDYKGTVANGSSRSWSVSSGTHTIAYGYASDGEPTESETLNFSDRNWEITLYPE